MIKFFSLRSKHYKFKIVFFFNLTILIKTPENDREEQLLDEFLTMKNIRKVIRTIRKNDALGAIIRRNKFELIKEPLIAHTVTLSEVNEKETSSNSN